MPTWWETFPTIGFGYFFRIRIIRSDKVLLSESDSIIRTLLNKFLSGTQFTKHTISTKTKTICLLILKLLLGTNIFQCTSFIYEPFSQTAHLYIKIILRLITRSPIQRITKIGWNLDKFSQIYILLRATKNFSITVTI